jgi:hypothetical protein
MLHKPLGKRFSRAFGEQIDRAVRGQINNDRAICLPTAERKIVHTNSGWRVPAAGN